MLKRGDKQGATILAKQLVRTRQQTTRSLVASSKMGALSAQATVRKKKKKERKKRRKKKENGRCVVCLLD